MFYFNAENESKVDCGYQNIKRIVLCKNYQIN